MAVIATDNIDFIATMLDGFNIPWRADLDDDGNTVYVIYSHLSDEENMAEIEWLSSEQVEIWLRATAERHDVWQNLSAQASRSFDGLARHLERERGAR
jgi:SH3-like domain-containing protein